MAERLWAGGVDAGVAILHVLDAVLSFGHDARELQLFAEHLRELLHRDVDLEHMVAGVVARALAGLDLSGLEDVADLAVALAGPTGVFVSELEARQLDRRERNGADL